MTDPEAGRLADIEAELAAEDPVWARQFGPVPNIPVPPVHQRREVRLTALLALALLVVGLTVGSAPLALLAVPVVATPVVLHAARTRLDRREDQRLVHH